MEKLATAMRQMKIFKVKSKVKSAVRNYRYAIKLKKMLVGIKPSQRIPLDIFNEIDDEFWFWLYTEGYRRSPELRQLLPTMPDKTIQENFTGQSGDATLKEAFGAYKLFKSITVQYSNVVARSGNVLDFGCGWGRIIRFFIKDMEPSGLYGSDCDNDMIKLCKDSNIWCNFELNNPYPPTKFTDNMFDLIYSYSVFSHLSEDAHMGWLNEFQRILKPGGVVIATTRPREFINECAVLRKHADIPGFASGGAASFLDTRQALQDYDDGKYCYSPTGGGGVRDGSFYGETCIPQKYVEKEWARIFGSVSFLECERHRSFNQNVIIGRKAL